MADPEEAAYSLALVFDCPCSAAGTHFSACLFAQGWEALAVGSSHWVAGRCLRMSIPKYSGLHLVAIRALAHGT